MEKQIMRGKAPVMICAALSLLGFFACIAAIIISTVSALDPNANFSFELVWNNLYYRVLPVVPCLLFSLYIFFFRQKTAGVFLLPAAFVLAAIHKLVAVINNAQQIPYYITNNFGSLVTDTVTNICIYILYIAAYAVLLVAAIKGFPSKPLVIPASIVLMRCNLYTLINNIHLHIKLSTPLNTVNMITFAVLFALYTGILIYGILNRTPSFSEVFRRAGNRQTAKNTLRERNELEERLEELKLRRDNGYLPQEDYDELVAEITQRLSELQ